MIDSGPGGGDDGAGDDGVVARVVPDVTGVDKTFDYLVPHGWDLEVGDRVRVELHGRRVGGWIVSLGSMSQADVAPERLKPLAKFTGRGPEASLIELAGWARWRWAARGVRPFLVAASPSRAVRELPDPVHGGASLDRRDPLVAQRLDDGGGVVRVGPSHDPLGAVAAAAAGGRTLVIVPTFAPLHRLASRLRDGGLSVATWPDEWAAAAGGVDVTIGTRVAVWARIPQLRSIVVIDEHDEALQDERTPTWHARDVATGRGRLAGIPVVLISPTPTLSAFVWAGERVTSLDRAASRAAWPIADIVDRRRDEPWKTSLVTSPLITALRDHERTVVCVHNTTGRARVLACRSCRALQRCEHCGAAVSLGDDERFHCARCGADRPAVCQSCGGTGFANLRPGVTRVREELEAAAARPVVAVTGDDTEPPAPAGVYVGTEAVLHRVERADVVAFLDLDAELLAPRYRAAEQAMALLVRAARLVGDRSSGGRLLVQTFLPRHEVLQALLLADPDRVVRAESERRRALELPPFGALARITGAGSDTFVETLGTRPGLRVGPASGKRAGWLVHAADQETLSDALLSTQRPQGARLRLEVDPPRV